MKKVAVSELREFAWVAYWVQIMNNESGRAQKFKKERSREDRYFSVHDCAREKDCHLRIARNRTGSILEPNNE